MKLLRSVFCLFILCICEIHSTVQTFEPERFCFPTNALEAQDDVLLRKSYTCTELKYISQMLSNIPLHIEEIVILNSHFNENEKFKSDEKKYDSLHSVKIIKSFFGSALLDWMSSLENLHNVTLYESANSFTIRHDDQNITTIDMNITSFRHLEMVQISKGNITNLEISDALRAPILDLAGNQFECGHDYIWLLNIYEESVNKVNLNDTVCFMRKINESVIYPMVYSLKGKAFMPVMKYRKEALVNCPPKCICELKGMLTVERPQLNVDCIGLNMTKLPDVIPKGSSRCNFSYNLIEDLAPLYTNRVYDKVAMMALSHNYISFLDPVKFPDLLRKRRDVGFWLDHNRLVKFPAETVKKVYDELHTGSRYMPQFVLGHNPWMCTCDYIAHFQDLIYQHMYDIVDSREIRCSEEDLYNPGIMILGLDVGTLCDKEPIFNTLDIVNIFLALLLVILIVDFIYNYRQYRKNRKLPWIVTKFKC